jgi:hypothetical protein
MFDETDNSEINRLEYGAGLPRSDRWPAWPNAKRAFAPGWRRAALKESRGDRSLRPSRSRHRQAIRDFATFAVERELFPTTERDS